MKEEFTQAEAKLMDSLANELKDVIIKHVPKLQNGIKELHVLEGNSEGLAFAALSCFQAAMMKIIFKQYEVTGEQATEIVIRAAKFYVKVHEGG